MGNTVPSMKQTLLISCCLLTGMAGYAQPPSINGYHVYYGHLHNHTGASDGKDTAFHAYPYARDSSKMDFFGLADHCWLLRPGEWDTIRMAADAYNQDGVFVTFAGFEWSSPVYGHLTIIHTEKIAYYYRAESDNFIDIVNWLNKNDGYAFMNHPGDEEGGSETFSHFNTVPSPRILGMELWGKTEGFSRFYYNDGFYHDDNGKSFYDEVLLRGWRPGATGSEDNHSATWGKSNRRMAILATALTRNDLLEAMKARRFYSTEDKNLVLSFCIQGNEMGSEVAEGNDTFCIRTFDKENERFVRARLVCNGIVADSIVCDTTFLEWTLVRETHCGEYYYVIVTQQDGEEAISSPVWIRGKTNHQPPLPISGSFAPFYYQDDSATLTIPVENGITQMDIFYDSMKVKTDSVYPFDYRLKLRSIGKFPVNVTLFDSQCGSTGLLYDYVNVIKRPKEILQEEEQRVSFYPNPCSEVIFITGARDFYRIVITDMQGKIRWQAEKDFFLLQKIDVSSLEAGIYLLSIYTGGKTTNSLLVKSR